MNVGLNIVRSHVFAYETHQTTRDKIEAAHTRAARTAIERSTYRAWQKSKYGDVPLLKAFMKYPNASLNTILAEWSTYINSQEYAQQRHKHAPRLQGCNGLRDDLQQLRSLRKQAAQGRGDERTLMWFNSGEMDRELERLTIQHGAGRYYGPDGNAIDLRPLAFEDCIANRGSQSASDQSGL